MHYAFDQESRARQFFKNVSLKLRPGGYFIGTIPSAGWIVYTFRPFHLITTLEFLTRDKLSRAGGSKKSFGNSLYNISVDDDFVMPPPAFGAKYNFFLLDAVGNVPEYLVNTDLLVKYVSPHLLLSRYFIKVNWVKIGERVWFGASTTAEFHGGLPRE